MDNKKEINPDYSGVTKLDVEGEVVSSLDSDINREVTKEDSSSSIDCHLSEAEAPTHSEENVATEDNQGERRGFIKFLCIVWSASETFPKPSHQPTMPRRHHRLCLG